MFFVIQSSLLHTLCKISLKHSIKVPSCLNKAMKNIYATDTFFWKKQSLEQMNEASNVFHVWKGFKMLPPSVSLSPAP